MTSLSRDMSRTCGKERSKRKIEKKYKVISELRFSNSDVRAQANKHKVAPAMDP